jgi:hypothetical protein
VATSRPASPRSENSAAWARTVGIVAVVAILVGGGLYVFDSLRRLPADAVAGSKRLARDLVDVAAAFRQGRIEISFTSYATSVTGSSYLQFASLRQTETYTRQDEASLLWGRLELPDVIVSATAPVDYTYYLDLDEDWEFRLEGGTLSVLAPPIRFNRPAIDASEIRYEVRASSLLRDEGAALEQLKRGLSVMSERRAREHIVVVREVGRAKVREFVERWLAGSFGDAEAYRVVVRFADEAPLAATERPPT